jgi:hypothetical protein
MQLVKQFADQVYSPIHYPASPWGCDLNPCWRAFLKIRCHCWLSWRVNSAFSRVSKPLRDSTITSRPTKAVCWVRNDSLIKRLNRLRWTARRRCFLAITKPRRPFACWLLRAKIRKCWCDARNGASSKTFWKPEASSKRRDLGKEAENTGGESHG